MVVVCTETFETRPVESAIVATVRIIQSNVTGAARFAVDRNVACVAVKWRVETAATLAQTVVGDASPSHSNGARSTAKKR
jgi:hypothetical protein